MPASSITRAEASISSSGSIVSCMTPTRNGWLTRSAGVFDRGCWLFGGGGTDAGRLLHLLVERVEDVGDLLPDDRLQHALPHRPDRPGDRDVCLPAHQRLGAGRGELKLGLHAHDRPDAVALGLEACVLGRALLRLLESDPHFEAAEAERDVAVRMPVPLVLNLEALDPRDRVRQARRVVEHLPHGLLWNLERPLAGDVHRDSTSTRPRE